MDNTKQIDNLQTTIVALNAQNQMLAAGILAIAAAAGISELPRPLTVPGLSLLCDRIAEAVKARESYLATATAAGRAEAVAIIMSISPEDDPLEDCVDCSGPSLDGERNYSWNENKLLEKFKADAKHFQLLSKSDARAEVLFYENLQYKQDIAELEVELESLYSQQPAAWQSNFIGENDWGTCTKEHAEWVDRVPQEFVGYQTRALYARPVPMEVPETKP